MTTYRISPIAPDALEAIRARAVDAFANPLEPRRVQEAGAPLRCCLRDARVGEQIVLIAHQPASIGGPYAEIGPVFVHAEACDGWRGERWPAGFAHRRQLLRAYDVEGNQVDNIVVEPGAQEAGVEQLLARPEVTYVHSRNLLAGCFMFTIERTA